MALPKIIAFTVPGKPVPKGRPRLGQNKHTGKSVAYTPASTKSYESIVGWEARAAMRGAEPLQCPVKMTVDIYHRLKGDVDNFGKAILDACNQIIFKDDDQVVSLTVRKFKVVDKQDERVEVAVEVVEGGQA